MLNRIAVVLCLSVAIAGCRTIEPEPPAESPRIVSFTASKTRTAPGEEVTLNFTTTGAGKLELTDDSGNGVQLEGTVEEGTARVAPTRSAFYVLRATGAGGRDTAFLQIAVNEPLRDVFLIPVPAAIDSGAEAQLLWGAAGATSVTLATGSGAAEPLTGNTGSITVTPASTERYTLTAQGAPGTPPLTAIAGVLVRPVLADAALAAADGIEAGKTLTFSWRTAGATRVTVSERTFGQLTSITEVSSVAAGTFDFVLPATLPSGIDVVEGLPLYFTVSASSGDTVVSKQLERVVGQRPLIEVLNAPESVSVGQRFTVDWKTLNATAVSIDVNGLPVFRTLGGDQARVDLGSVSLAAPTTQTEYTLVASNELGLTTQRTFTVRPVALPVINTFTLTGALNAVGDPITAGWTTSNAVRVQLRFENGPTLATVTTATQVASGSTVLTLASSARVTLEASNAAGDAVRETRAVTFNGAPAVFITPTPVLRGANATLSWTLAPAGVTEVVGLPTPAPAPIQNSTQFIDLAAVATAQTLFFTDPANGSAKVPALPGFYFPLVGRAQNELWVSANGFIAFAKPAALSANADLSAASNSSPSMLAPLWDDLNLGPAASVLYALQTSSGGEQLLVVQWEKASLASDPASELTFQAQLFETGQVRFVYKTITGTVSSATVGVKDSSLPPGQIYGYNSTTLAPVTDLELNFFAGGPADGTLDFVAGAARRIEFIGRTPTGQIPASAELRSLAAGDVAITEVMPFPEISVSALGQWIELRNTTSDTLNMEGLVVDTLGSTDGGYVLPPNTVLDAGAFLVLGQSLDPNDTGGANVSLVLTDAPLAAVDRVRVLVEGTPLSTFSWDAGTPGTSLQSAGADLLLATGQALPPCTRMITFGPAGAFGTPGAANESCAPYSSAVIPADYRTPPASAGLTFVQVGTTFPAEDEGQARVTLTTPFTYFGTAFTELSLVANGFLTFGPPITASSFSNPSTPSTSTPNAVVAPFWDDLYGNTGYRGSAWRETDRSILAWERFYAYSATTTFLDFQVHLLDSGVIEFHYGALEANSGAASDLDRVSGDSATIWLESLTGGLAVPWSVNRAGAVRPFSGIRFTPKP